MKVYKLMVAAMRHDLKVIILIILMSLPALVFPARIKDLVNIRGLQDQQLIGYSLVTGLDGTGDTRRALMTVQAVRNMMTKFGMNLPDENMNLRNVASVMVIAKVSPFAQSGSQVDVIVSSLGDATSLEGGTLLPTQLFAPNKQVVATAQGPVSIGGFNIETEGGEKYRKNYALAGRVPNGAIMTQDANISFANVTSLDLLLRDPDFTSAVRIAEAINTELGATAAKAVDPGRVELTIADASQAVSTIARIEVLDVNADQQARVVINERTGTVVVGNNVKLAPVAVAHGNLTIRVSSQPVISQPNAFSGGTTVVVPQTQTEVIEDGAGTVAVLNNMASVNDLAAMLNNLQVTPRDIIAIFQALKTAGALQAELVIM
ncbi:MAG TPA: flagellar basal body P-ring protein FlgI [bacterium]|nr:flagellar basal body P-ring protein FlgI [bacterium]HPN43214.1 flagellar basal body P-ring protein FlgI [bacterium]